MGQGITCIISPPMPVLRHFVCLHDSMFSREFIPGLLRQVLHVATHLHLRKYNY